VPEDAVEHFEALFAPELLGDVLKDDGVADVGVAAVAERSGRDVERVGRAVALDGDALVADGRVETVAVEVAVEGFVSMDRRSTSSSVAAAVLTVTTRPRSSTMTTGFPRSSRAARSPVRRVAGWNSNMSLPTKA